MNKTWKVADVTRALEAYAAANDLDVADLRLAYSVGLEQNEPVEMHLQASWSDNDEDFLAYVSLADCERFDARCQGQARGQ